MPDDRRLAPRLETDIFDTGNTDSHERLNASPDTWLIDESHRRRLTHLVCPK